MAAVVEYHATFVGTTADEQLAHRVDEYVNFVARASAQRADIIVFPESTLTRAIGQSQLVPEPADRVVPCNRTEYYGNPLERLSCAARNGSIYVVINLTMRRRCASKDECLYNTNVVLDRSGAVISM